jgi:hypothetical protein
MGELDRGPRAAVAWRPRLLTTMEIAWIAVLPWAVVTVAAIALLGPPLGHLLFARGHDRLWPVDWWETTGHPEPVKHGRVLLATLSPLLLAAAIVAGSRARLSLRPPLVRAIVAMAVAATVALAAVSLYEQHPLLLPTRPAPPIFGLGSALAAAAMAAACWLVVRSPSAVARIMQVARETSPQRVVCLVVAVGFAAAWLLRAVVTDGDVSEGSLNLPWTFDDAIAVLDGRTPLVDYHLIYSKLLPYLTAAVLAVFGTSLVVYTAFMAVLNGLVLTAVYTIFRRVTRSSLLALGLFLPFVAASDVDPNRDPTGLQSPLTLSAMWPMRYGGAYVMAWLTVRSIDRRRPRRMWAIFLVGGLAVINNVEFGTAAVLASFAAFLCARPPQSARRVLTLMASAAGGMLAAAAVVAVLTGVRTGELADPGLLLEWPRIFTNLGWFSMPLPTWDLHVAIYATFVAAFALAVVRAIAPPADDALLTGMLAWSGVFGLMASSYYVGRPDMFKLTGVLSAWSFALAMLTIASVRALARGRGRPLTAHLLVLFGFALTVVLLARMPQPLDQVRRLATPPPDPTYLPSVERFVRAHTRPGDKVAILVPMGHRVAHDLKLENVSPYSFMNAIVTRSQFETLLDVLEHEDVRTVFTAVPGSVLLREGDTAPQQLERLIQFGFRLTDEAPGLLELRRA